MAERAAIGAGTRVLDVGCGTGGFCAFASARGALVAGVDLDPDRIAAARARVPAGDFVVGSMEQLPWTDGAFDVVTGFNSFQYALDVPAALAEAVRVSCGCVAVCKYGNPRENEFFAFLAALHPDRFDLARLPHTDDVDRALERYEIRDHGVDRHRDDVRRRRRADAGRRPSRRDRRGRRAPPARRQLPLRAAAQVPDHRLRLS